MIEDLRHSVVVTLPVRSAVAPIERAWVRELERRGTLAGSDRLVLVHAARGEALTDAKVREIIGTDDATAREILHRPRDENFLEQRGRHGGASYHLVGDLAPPAGLRLGPEELAEFVVAMAAKGRVSSADVRKETGLERGEALGTTQSLGRRGAPRADWGEARHPLCDSQARQRARQSRASSVRGSLSRSRIPGGQRSSNGPTFSLIGLT